ncbi:MAG: YceD family protein [Acidimicrobiia bacterium]
MSGLAFDVGDLVGHPGLYRQVQGELGVKFEVGESTVDDNAVVNARLEWISDGVLVTASATTVVTHQCARCLTEWTGELEVRFTEMFARHPTEEQSGVNPDATVDLGPVVHDELSLALPSDPICRPDCQGLCPTCGADLNVEPCAGHGDESASPFAALKQLFEAET